MQNTLSFPSRGQNQPRERRQAQKSVVRTRAPLCLELHWETQAPSDTCCELSEPARPWHCGWAQDPPLSPTQHPGRLLPEGQKGCALMENTSQGGRGLEERVPGRSCARTASPSARSSPPRGGARRAGARHGVFLPSVFILGQWVTYVFPLIKAVIVVSNI